MRLLTLVTFLTCLLILGAVSCSSSDVEAGDKESTNKVVLEEIVMAPEEPAGDSLAAFRHPVRSKDNQIVTISTNYGDMTLELWHDVAPNHADSFVARTNDGFYDSLIFHRVVTDFMIQGGCPKKNGTGNAGYFLNSEFSDNLHMEGSLSMARSRSPHSASCQFFICLKPAPMLDKEPNKYTVFGQLLKGYDVLHKIGEVEVKAAVGGREVSSPVNEVTMEKVFLSDAEGKPLEK
ncbi:MAG: peptidylprolyl isomerase [candidate division Zixibacteria bacterium]|nr:peptidylprolyl isomerase [candidate division Zixibacteria bacterium]